MLCGCPWASESNSSLALFSATIEQDFLDHILSFDLGAAVVYAQIASRCETKGRPIDSADTQLAAICLVQDAPLATRNTNHFEGLGLRVINPWL